ncbi:MAG: DUF1330 domain-containing protein [Actinomycetota bacterium]|nr:DUF1330 domain-containing protein [Actinomycetota bacterium]
MTAYVFVEIDFHDPSALEEYKRLATIAGEKHGATYLARGGATELLEGMEQPKRVTLLQFPDMASAKAWYESPEYTEARGVRAQAASGRFIAVEGLDASA